MRNHSLRVMGVAIAGVFIAAAVARAQATPSSPSASRLPTFIIVDGERMPPMPGVFDSLRLGRATVDSSVTPARWRISVGNAPGGAVFFPMEDNIQEIEVLKGPRAALVYGDSAATGVIIVTSKRPSVRRGGGSRDGGR